MGNTTGAVTNSYIHSRGNTKESRTHVRAALGPLAHESDVRKFLPHDAALDGAVSGTDGLGVRDGSLHPGDLGVPGRRVNFREPHRGNRQIYQ